MRWGSILLRVIDKIKMSRENKRRSRDCVCKHVVYVLANVASVSREAPTLTGNAPHGRPLTRSPQELALATEIWRTQREGCGEGEKRYGGPWCRTDFKTSRGQNHSTNAIVRDVDKYEWADERTPRSGRLVPDDSPALWTAREVRIKGVFSSSLC